MEPQGLGDRRVLAFVRPRRQAARSPSVRHRRSRAPAPPHESDLARARQALKRNQTDDNVVAHRDSSRCGHRSVHAGAWILARWPYLDPVVSCQCPQHVVLLWKTGLGECCHHAPRGRCGRGSCISSASRILRRGWHRGCVSRPFAPRPPRPPSDHPRCAQFATHSLARFQREAQFLASLNHPNIAQIHGIEEDEGTRHSAHFIRFDRYSDAWRRNVLTMSSMRISMDLSGPLLSWNFDLSRRVECVICHSVSSWLCVNRSVTVPSS